MLYCHSVLRQHPKPEKDRGGVNNHYPGHSWTDRKSSTSCPLVIYFIYFIYYGIMQHKGWSTWPNPTQTQTWSLNLCPDPSTERFLLLWTWPSHKQTANYFTNTVIRNVSIFSLVIQYVSSKPSWLGCWIRSRGYCGDACSLCSQPLPFC